jgi:hypothetical protein
MVLAAGMTLGQRRKYVKDVVTPWSSFGYSAGVQQHR